MGLRIKKLRNSKSLTQKQLADLCNIGDKHLSCVERGLSGLSDEALILLCMNLNTSTDYILTGQVPTDNSSPIVSLYNQIPPNKRHFFEEATKELIKMFDSNDYN